MYSIGSCELIWPMNLLTDEVLTVTTRDGGASEAASLPSLLAGMARGEVAAFPAMRPHQRPAWHMFLVQLGALAMWTARQSDLPTQPGAWADMLRALAPDHADDAPWRLVGLAETKPAFMQPPVPCADSTAKGLKWSPVETPDALDLLITSRNHDLKAAVAKGCRAEDWVFALVSLQTSEGYNGSGKYGIARMNGGASSRPMLRLAAAGVRDMAIDPSASWARDVRLLLKDRAESDAAIGKVGGLALLWCLAWPEGEQLEIRKLDPWFIEICRRVRLSQVDTQLTAHSSTSRRERINGKAFKGNVGDPWAPVELRSGKSLTLSGKSFTYGLLHELLYSGNWAVPLLAQASTEDPSDLALVAEALSRGNSKTEGFKSRIVPVPRSVRRLFASDTARDLAKAQMKEIKGVNQALRYAVALGAAHGEHEKLEGPNSTRKGRQRLYGFADPATERLDSDADRLFFPSLWKRVAAADCDEGERHDAKVSFLRELKDAGDAALDEALAAIPRRAVYRERALVRARQAFVDKLRRTSACRDLFLGEDVHGPAG